MSQVCVLRTGAGSMPSSGVLDALAKLGCRVLAADANAIAVGYMQASAGFQIPYASDEQFVPALLQLCQDQSVDLIIPAVNEELIPLAKAREDFRAIGTSILLPSLASLECVLDKWSCYLKLKEVGIATPESCLADSAELAPEFAESMAREGLILKPRNGRGSKGVKLIRSQKELDDIEAEVRAASVLQSLQHGAEYTADLFCDADSNLRMASVRVRSMVSDGISVGGKIVSSKDVREQLSALCRALELRGPSCVQYFLGENSVAYFTDINPRFGGGVAFSLEAGTPLVKAAIDLHLSKEIGMAFDRGLGLCFMRSYKEYYFQESQSLVEQSYADFAKGEKPPIDSNLEQHFE